MKNTMKVKMMIAAAITLLMGCTASKESNTPVRWSEEKAWEWYNQQGWIVGCNFSPSSAINQLEMWQAETFDPTTIDRELSWAADLGFNSMRVYLHSLVWQADSVEFKKRVDQYLSIADKHKIKTVFVFFDDCWQPEAKIGKQPEPKVGVHNSGWVHDPIASLRSDTVALYKTLQPYVQDMLNTFKNDKRILMWDLYNEPGNTNQAVKSLPLLKQVFKWAREVNPSQPLTAGVWRLDFHELNKFQFENSDIITYHCYYNKDRHQDWIHMMKAEGRPVVCTEWMGRCFESTFEKVMPMLKEQNIGAFSWGFVAGKTNTIFAWDDPRPNGEEPEVWFHDILRVDGTPYDSKETDFIKTLTRP